MLYRLQRHAYKHTYLGGLKGRGGGRPHYGRGEGGTEGATNNNNSAQSAGLAKPNLVYKT